LACLGYAFDEAWASIAESFGEDTTVIEGARMRLATVLLSLGGDGLRDVEALKNAALARMR